MKKLMLLFVILVMGSMVAQAGMELTSARVYKKQGDLQKALEWYDREIEAHPNSVAGHFEKGELLGEMAEGQKKPGLFLQMRKEFDEVLNLKDEQAKKVRKYEKKMNELVEKYWIFQYNDAVEQFRFDDNDSALNARASQLAGDKWNTLGSTDQDSLREIAQKEYWNQSRKILDIAMAIDPERWETYALQSNIQSAEKDMQGAESSLKKAIEKHVKPSGEKTGKTNIQQTEKEWKRTQLDMMENLAQVLYGLKKYQETVKTCDEILAIDPQDVLAIKFIAFSWNQLGEKDKAIDSYQKAIEAQPDNTDLLYNAAQLYLQAGDTAKAIKCFADFIAINPKDFEVVFQLGVIYLEGGTFTDNNKAKEIFGEAVKDFPDNAVMWTNYGVALIRAGDTEEGRKALEKAKELKGE